jgi:hypothetical protein
LSLPLSVVMGSAIVLILKTVKQIRPSLKMGSRADPPACLVIDRDQVIGHEKPSK